MAMSQDHGNNLQTVQLLLKKNQVGKSYPALRQHHNCLIVHDYLH